MAEVALDFEQVSEDDEFEVWEATTSRALTAKTLTEIANTAFKGSKLDAVYCTPESIVVRTRKGK